VKALT